jgi:hypothetical protein
MWVAARRSDVPYTGEQLSSEAFAPDCKTPTFPWIPAQVPGTVLGALVQNGDVPDPNVGLASLEVHDIGEVGPEAYTYWFCVCFELPSNPGDADKGTWWLELDGVNYSLQIFLNGSRVPIDGDRGMFLRRRINVTDFICAGDIIKLNYMAVLVAPPDHYGKIPAGGGQGGDHSLAQDVVSQFFEGWDWIIPVHDRGTGIWGDVRLRKTGSICLSDAYAIPSLSPQALTALARDPTADVDASVVVSVTVCNTSDVAATCELNMDIQHVDPSGTVVLDVMVCVHCCVRKGCMWYVCWNRPPSTPHACLFAGSQSKCNCLDKLTCTRALLPRACMYANMQLVCRCQKSFLFLRLPRSATHLPHRQSRMRISGGL